MAVVARARRRRLGVESLELRDVPAGWWGGWSRSWSPPANSQVSGLVYADRNGDGVAQDWERRLEGVTVTLSGRDDGGNSVSRTATTDAGGIYRFTALPSGNFTLEMTTPAGYTAGGNTTGAFGGTPGGSTIRGLYIPNGQSSGGYNFGALVGVPPPPPVCPPPAATSQVSGLVYADQNRDGVAQDWERRLRGVTVTLTGTTTAGAQVNQTTTTDSGGIYYFRSLPAGTYAIRVTTPAGYTAGQATVGAFGGDPRPNDTTKIVIPPGQSSGAYDFGQLTCVPPPRTAEPPPPVQTSAVGGFAYLDLERDGTFNNFDPLLPDVQVTITGTTTGGVAVSRTTTTAADGTYNFADLAAGTYTVAATPPIGLLTGISEAGSFGGTPGENQVADVPVPAGQTSVGYNFGFQEPRPR